MNKIQLTKRFDRYRSAYPKKVNKVAAEMAWMKLRPSEEELEMYLAAIAKQKLWRENAKKTGQFVPEWPHPATWLNGKRWEDEVGIEPERSNPFV